MGTSKRRAKASQQQDPGASAAALDDPSFYVNRELSLLSFQHRVLQEARDESNPLLERVKFLSIVGSNLDEFFMVRVAGLIAQVDAGSVEAGPDGMSPSAQLVAIRREVKKLLVEAHQCWRDLCVSLADSGVEVLDYADLNDKQRAHRRRAISRTRFSGPHAARLRSRPSFPDISNRSLNLAVLIRDSEGQGPVCPHPRFQEPCRSCSFIVSRSRRAKTVSAGCALRMAGAGDLGQPGSALPWHACCRVAPVPCYPRCRGRHQGT